MEGDFLTPPRLQGVVPPSSVTPPVVPPVVGVSPSSPPTPISTPPSTVRPPGLRPTPGTSGSSSRYRTPVPSGRPESFVVFVEPAHNGPNVLPSTPVVPKALSTLSSCLQRTPPVVSVLRPKSLWTRAEVVVFRDKWGAPDAL